VHSGWLTPDWPAPQRVRALCTTRTGGVSLPPYDSLNLGDHVGDDARAVAGNRRAFADALQATPVFLQQVHGTDVARLASGSPGALQADGCVTTDAGVACTIMVADCLPVLITDRDGNAVAAAHAGWRGLAGSEGRGILEHVVDDFRNAVAAAAPGSASDILAWLGPCIGPRAFEVGSDVKHAFCAANGAVDPLFAPRAGGKWLADLAGLARLRLAALGVTRIHGNDSSDAWCTVNNPSRFFSHRRDRVSGRFAAAIWLT
jgi:polyphenol oxidase